MGGLAPTRLQDNAHHTRLLEGVSHSESVTCDAFDFSKLLPCRVIGLLATPSRAVARHESARAGGGEGWGFPKIFFGENSSSTSIINTYWKRSAETLMVLWTCSTGGIRAAGPLADTWGERLF